ncbi:hypothetical protein BBP40_009234 [Aspergillus hancockii]|nr:hypothetical protein BBP40_009234 [Aspergillus hancockii]
MNKKVKGSQPPRFATCSITDCMRPDVRERCCAYCRKHACAKHQSKEHRVVNLLQNDEACEKANNDEVSELLFQVNTLELARIGTKLNNEVKCTFQPGKYIGSGSSAFPEQALATLHPTWWNTLLRVEYATLKFLEPTKVPAPQVYGYGLASEPTSGRQTGGFSDTFPGMPRSKGFTHP